MSVTKRIEIQTQGVTRSFFVRLPGASKPPPGYPVVISMHGKTSQADRGTVQLTRHRSGSRFTGPCESLEEEPVILIAPNAVLGKTPSGGTWYGPWEANEVDQARDFLFLDDIIDWVVDELDADGDRVFLSGFSAGCIFTMALSNDPTYSQAYAGFGGLGATVPGFLASVPATPLDVPVLYSMGLDDHHYPGGTGGGLTFDESHAWWLSRMGPTLDPVASSVTGCGGGQGVAEVQTYGGDLIVATVSECGHSWPKPGASSGVHIARMMWELWGLV